MIKYDVAFIDLDDTIYNTRQLKEDVYSLFEPTGVSHEQFIKAYRRAAELPEPGYFHYTFEKQIEAIREAGFNPPENILDDLNGLLKRNYLIDGAEKFLAFLKQICLKTVLLTAGTIDFQKKKIDATKAGKMVDEVIQIAGGKDDVLSSYAAKNKNILFINDNLDENIIVKKKFPATAVLTLLNLSYWTEEDCVKSEILWFKNLDDIIHYLQTA